MAGLLDFFTSTDPAEQAARMQMAQGLLSGQGSSISRLAGGMGAYQQAMAQAKKEEEIRRAREQQAQMQALQQQMLQQQMQQAQARQEAEKRAAMTQQTDEGLMRRLAGMPVEQPMPQGQVGPGMPQRNPGIDPLTFLNQGGSMGGLQQAMALSQALAPASSKPLVSKPGDIARDPTTGQILWENPAEAARETPTQLAKLIQERDSLPPGHPNRRLYDQEIVKMTTHAPGVSVSYGAPVAGIGPDGKPVFFQPDKGGGAPSIIPGVTPDRQQKALTEAQAKAAAFVSQMQAAESELSSTKFNPNSLKSQVEVGMAGGATNLLVGQEAQRARQAQEQWAEAFLRFKTGAASTEDEVRRNIRTYFPQPGDGPAVVEQKKRQREQAMQDVAIASGQKGAPKKEQAGQPARITSDAEYDALPSGATFIGPDGKTRRKP
jgi:hypothetical protein